MIVTDDSVLCSLGWVTCGLGLLGHFVTGISGRKHMTVPILISWIPTCALLGSMAFILVSDTLLISIACAKLIILSCPVTLLLYVYIGAVSCRSVYARVPSCIVALLWCCTCIMVLCPVALCMYAHHHAVSCRSVPHSVNGVGRMDTGYTYSWTSDDAWDDASTGMLWTFFLKHLFFVKRGSCQGHVGTES